MSIVVNSELAEKEFFRFADSMGIDVDVDDMEHDDKQSFFNSKKIIIKAIMFGSLIINDNGEPVFTPQRSENRDPITFYEPTGKSILSMDKRGKGQDVARMYEVLGEITKTHAQKFANLKISDLKICQTISIFFLV